MRLIAPAAFLLLPCVALRPPIAQDKTSPNATAISAISTDKAPVPVGPDSQGSKAGGFILCAGQGAFDPARSTAQGERWPAGSLVAIEVIALAR